MANDFRSARFWAVGLLEPALYNGARVIDATMGNGHDTQWLCEQVGDVGRVYAFDIQPEAVEHTRERLASAGLLDRAELICDGHQHMSAHVREPVDAILFNLGWLPGAAHTVTTRVETTLAAVQTGLALLKPDGLMTVCVYPGHEEGARELAALTEWASGLDSRRYDAMLQGYLNQPKDPPRLIAVRRKPTKQDRTV